MRFHAGLNGVDLEKIDAEEKKKEFGKVLDRARARIRGTTSDRLELDRLSIEEFEDE